MTIFHGNNVARKKEIVAERQPSSLFLLKQTWIVTCRHIIMMKQC